ncbi:monovalent cation/H(+) antiporter subunit G [Halomonas chromatireducens]|uniref:Na(+)/H(+) antiporter subunit G n=1 Tax=Halomonas chromatireducens TaxID=507626 RepID=A0A0X8HE46_9GAMM|nr:monovalent cation/H(+) antiporter subunit G [Halomonas chromatireducens]AMD00972.1 Na(+)/H(+) antiporter subunit G [Halomonas chromatireducens]
MTEALHWLGYGFVAAGILFFLAGSLGLLRFPDVFTRLHALTKADNLGLGLICLGLAFQASGLAEAVKYLLIWLLMLVASGIGATLIASTALACGLAPQQADMPSNTTTSERPAPK